MSTRRNETRPPRRSRGNSRLLSLDRRAKAAPEFPGDRGQLVAAIARQDCALKAVQSVAPLFRIKATRRPRAACRCGVLGVRSRCSAVPMFAKPPRRPRRRLTPCVFFPNRHARTPQGFAEVGKRRLLKVGQRAERHIAESLPDVLKGYALRLVKLFGLALGRCAGGILEAGPLKVLPFCGFSWSVGRSAMSGHRLFLWLDASKIAEPPRKVLARIFPAGRRPARKS